MAVAVKSYTVIDACCCSVFTWLLSSKLGRKLPSVDRGLSKEASCGTLILPAYFKAQKAVLSDMHLV